MSILNRLRLTAHLDDAGLTAIWTDASATGVRRSHAHLESCSTCRGRYTELASWLETLRLDAKTEADDSFPPERLAAQHAQIFRRLEAAERPARVIAFPTFAQPLTSRTSHASRWIAAAAAAGLIVGVGVGQLMDLRHSLTRATTERAAPTTMAAQRLDPRLSPVNVMRDEAFLSELDASLSRAAVPELRALDAFTPRASDLPR